MSESISKNGEKKLIRVDISSDTVCVWCFIGKRNLDQAMTSTKHQFDFEVKWHPYILNPSAPKVGVNKKDLLMQKLGSHYEGAIARMTEVFRTHGLQYSMSGLTGNTMDSHRLIAFAGHQGLDKQHALVEELFLGYYTQGKYIGDREYLIEASSKAGVEGAAEFLEDPNNGVDEVVQEIQQYSSKREAVPYYVINGKQKISGAKPPEVFVIFMILLKMVISRSYGSCSKK